MFGRCVEFPIIVRQGVRRMNYKEKKTFHLPLMLLCYRVLLFFSVPRRFIVAIVRKELLHPKCKVEHG